MAIQGEVRGMYGGRGGGFIMIVIGTSFFGLICTFEVSYGTCKKTRDAYGLHWTCPSQERSQNLCPTVKAILRTVTSGLK